MFLKAFLDGQHITLVVSIVGLNIETISSGNSAELWSMPDELSPALVLNFKFCKKTKQRFGADEYKNPHHWQYLAAMQYFDITH